MKKSYTINVPYCAAVYGRQEIAAVVKVLQNPTKIVAGHAVREFEKKIARLFGKKHGIMTNSGSSANLLAFEIANLPPGSEVITPVLTFSTTLNPILQKGLSPVFVDVLPGAYVIDPDQAEALVSEKTKAIMAPSLIGNIPDLGCLQKIAKKHKLIVIEDSCDTVGATFNGRPTGYYTDISTTSFYASHIITAAGGGGMAMFHDAAQARRALVMANWGRESTLFGVYEKSEDIKKRFAGVLDGEPYDAKFLFTEVGYNFQPTELQGAFGLAQLKRLPEYGKKRRANFADLMKFFRKYEKFFVLPAQDKRVRTNWLALPLTIKEGAPFTRFEITKYLEERDIQTRPVFTGNVLKQPGYQKMNAKRVRPEGYPVTDHIMRNGFVIGCHHGLSSKQLNYMKKMFTEFLAKYS